ncbi:hypothetical protein PoB_004531900 [Plakobranchus ocellatus]|uniref:Uncharacterized protein n=1 Tax=Plakobranchus ocellatus TaxID=259542 RepID=A0AAV4BFF7_9GAST|nr:hypothetical protein PoB_004531900 [Plakobranchus ocellatus]
MLAFDALELHYHLNQDSHEKYRKAVDRVDYRFRKRDRVLWKFDNILLWVLPMGKGVNIHSVRSFHVHTSGAGLDFSSSEVSLSASLAPETHLGLLMREVEGHKMLAV